MSGSRAFGWARDEWRRIRDEYELYREQQYAAAVEACNCILLNREAIAAGVDEFSLFIGRRDRAERWASEELLAWWREHPHLTFAEFEAAAFEYMEVPA